MWHDRIEVAGPLAEIRTCAHDFRNSAVQKVKDRYDSAMAESLFSTLKRELVRYEACEDCAKARSAVVQRITIYYQRTRLHSALGYLRARSSRKGTAERDDTSYRVSILDGQDHRSDSRPKLRLNKSRPEHVANCANS